MPFVLLAQRSLALTAPFSFPLQLHGNNTIARTSGKITATALFGNRIDLATTGSGGITVTEAFLGMSPPTNQANDIPFTPPFAAGQNYSYPALILTSDRGDITITGVGGDPRAESFSKTDSVIVTSYAGDIKVEVNGGGVVANYTVIAAVGNAIVEVGGLAAGTSGKLGAGSDPVAQNQVYLSSQRGDVQLAELPGVL